MATYIISILSYGTEIDRIALSAKNISRVKEYLLDRNIVNEEWDITADAHDDEDIDCIIIYDYEDNDITMSDVEDIDLSDDYETMRIDTVEEREEYDEEEDY